MMLADLPPWFELVTALLVLCGSLLALIGAAGLLRLPTFFQRVHAPTLGSTLGCWCIVLATIVYFSVQERSLSVHAVLIGLFIAITAPVTTVFLMRAALFRERRAGNPAVPRNTTQT
ncbi:MAG: Na+/H+ antiporter subunit [Rhodoferax sp.]|nr:Na+/H+ antiporter subunit [Rhodoferax sp.]